jgi:hypothetical protein
VLGEVLHGAVLPLSTVTSMQLSWSRWTCSERERELVVVVEGLGQPPGQLAGGVVVDVTTAATQSRLASSVEAASRMPARARSRIASDGSGSRGRR